MSELLKINVNAHTEKKGQLTYLSWAWAWAEVLKIDPQAKWMLAQLGEVATPAFFFPDGTAMVSVAVTIKGDQKQAVLPVMDNRNKAIKNPDAFAINTAIMRALTKAIGMHGLGLYIYAGEDLPEGEDSAGMSEDVQADWVTYINDSATTGDMKRRLAEAVAAAMEVNDSRAVDKFNATAAAKAATAKAKATA